VFDHSTITQVTDNIAGLNRFGPSISADGRFIAFNSAGVDEPDQYSDDIFVYDRKNGTTNKVSLDESGLEANGWSQAPSISGDGRYVTFTTQASNLVPGDVNERWDIVIKAIPTVSVTSVVPDMLPIGFTTSVTIAGTNFLPGATPLLKGAQLSRVVIVDENTITMDVTVKADTPVGAQTLSVGLPGTGPGLLTGSMADCTDCVTFTSAPGC